MTEISVAPAIARNLITNPLSFVTLFRVWVEGGALLTVVNTYRNDSPKRTYCIEHDCRVYDTANQCNVITSDLRMYNRRTTDASINFDARDCVLARREQILKIQVKSIVAFYKLAVIFFITPPISGHRDI